MGERPQIRDVEAEYLAASTARRRHPCAVADAGKCLGVVTGGNRRRLGRGRRVPRRRPYPRRVGTMAAAGAGGLEPRRAVLFHTVGGQRFAGSVTAVWGRRIDADRQSGRGWYFRRARRGIGSQRGAERVLRFVHGRGNGGGCHGGHLAAGRAAEADSANSETINAPTAIRPITTIAF